MNQGFAVDDSTNDIGPLRLLAGTHTMGILSDAQIRDGGLQLRDTRVGVEGL